MKQLTLVALSVILASSLASTQVVHWRIVKGPGYQQTADNTQPTTPSWHSVCCFLGTNDPGDATSITLSGGGIVGSLAYTQEGTEWFLETDFPSAAAMNATIPSSTNYTITLSGGTLGTLVQQAPLAAEVYANIPYLIGTSFTDVQSLDATMPSTVNWNDPGPVTQTSGSSAFEIYDPITDDLLHFDQTSMGASFGVIPAHTLLGLKSYGGFVEFTNGLLVSGVLGFGIDGDTSHNVAVDFPMATTSDGCQADLGFQGPGTAFYSVCGEGLDTGDISTVSLIGAAPNAAVYLLVSLPGGANLAAKGGTLVSVTSLIGGFPLVLGTDEFGTMAFPIPGGFGPFTVVSQCVIADPSQPFNFAISNAVSLAFGP